MRETQATATTKNTARHRAYVAWANAKRRCSDPKHPSYRYYGERGITMAAEWVDNFEAFLDHIGQHPGQGYSIDRIDNDRGYEPGNVRWANASEQRVNQRRGGVPTQSGTRGPYAGRIEWNGRRVTLRELVKEVGTSMTTIRRRMSLGMTPVEAAQDIQNLRENPELRFQQVVRATGQTITVDKLKGRIIGPNSYRTKEERRVAKRAREKEAYWRKRHGDSVQLEQRSCGFCGEALTCHVQQGSALCETCRPQYVRLLDKTLTFLNDTSIPAKVRKAFRSRLAAALDE